MLENEVEQLSVLGLAFVDFIDVLLESFGVVGAVVFEFCFTFGGEFECFSVEILILLLCFGWEYLAILPAVGDWGVVSWVDARIIVVWWRSRV